MFTKNDEKTIDKVMRRVVNEVVSEVVEQKLESKLKPLYDFRKEATGMLEAIFSDLQQKHDFGRSLDKRVVKLEQIHPDNSHASVL